MPRILLPEGLLQERHGPEVVRGGEHAGFPAPSCGWRLLVASERQWGDGLIRANTDVYPGSGRLIRPKRIYNLCLFHVLLCDIATCFATLLYHFTHIWTNLLTQCTQCQFLSSDVFTYSNFSPI